MLKDNEQTKMSRMTQEPVNILLTWSADINDADMVLKSQSEDG